MLGFLMRPFMGNTVNIRVVTSGQTFGAHEELLSQLGRKLNLQMDPARKRITLLFCPITSRVGSDVAAAMSSLTGDRQVILVLMHHTRDPTYSTVGTDWADVYPNVISSLHVLFHESVPGLLTCSQNNMAVDQMLRVLTFSISSNRIPTSSWKISRKFWVGVAITFVVIVGFLYFKRRAALLPSTEKLPEWTQAQGGSSLR